MMVRFSVMMINQRISPFATIISEEDKVLLFVSKFSRMFFNHFHGIFAQIWSIGNDNPTTMINLSSADVEEGEALVIGETDGEDILFSTLLSFDVDSRLRVTIKSTKKFAIAKDSNHIVMLGYLAAIASIT